MTQQMSTVSCVFILIPLRIASGFAQKTGNKMSKVYGEAVQDPSSGKWAFKMAHEDDGTIFQSDFIFDTQAQAEAELVKCLRGLGEIAKGAGV